MILTRGSAKESGFIAGLTRGDYSHAALVVSGPVTYESDGNIIGHRMLAPFGHVRIDNTYFSLVRRPGNPLTCGVYRHPLMDTITPKQFSSALQQEMRHSHGRDYSQLHRLVPLAEGLGIIRPVMERLLKIHDGFQRAPKVHGPFCSELVALFYERLGLRLFEVGEKTGIPSPNDLATSKLIKIDNVILERTDPRWKTIDRRGTSAGVGFFGPDGTDFLAPFARDRQFVELNVRAFDAFLRKVSQVNSTMLVDLLSHYQRQIKEVVELKGEVDMVVDVLGCSWLSHRLDRLLQLETLSTEEILHAKASPPEAPEAINALLMALASLTVSYTQCSALLGSMLARDNIKTRVGIRDVIFRFRTKRGRREALSTARSIAQKQRTPTPLGEFLKERMVAR